MRPERLLIFKLIQHCALTHLDVMANLFNHPVLRMCRAPRPSPRPPPGRGAHFAAMRPYGLRSARLFA